MTKQEYITLAIATLALVGVSVGYGWWFHTTGQLQTETQTLEAQVETARTASARASRIQDASSELLQEETIVRSHLVDTSDIVSFLHYVEMSGTDYGALVEVASVAQSPTKEEITLALHIEGSFSAVLRTLGTLEYGPYILQAKTVTLQSRDNDVWELTGSFTSLAQLP